MSDKRCYSFDEEHYYSFDGTRDEVIKEATSEADGNEHFWIAEQKEINPPVCAYSVIENIQEQAYEEIGEASEGWIKYTKDQESELSGILTEAFYNWCKKHNHLPNFFGVQNVEKIIL